MSESEPKDESSTAALKIARRRVSSVLFAIALYQLAIAPFLVRELRTYSDEESFRILWIAQPVLFVCLALWALLQPKTAALIGLFLYGICTIADLMFYEGIKLGVFLTLKVALFVALCWGLQACDALAGPDSETTIE
jgi:hypothetical protein